MGLLVGYICLVLCWCLLGAILNPDQFLPHAAAAGTFIVFSKSKYEKLKTFRDEVLKKIR